MLVEFIGASVQIEKNGSRKPENCFLINCNSLLPGCNTYFVSEDKPFWSTLKTNDTLTFVRTTSPKFGDCLLIKEHGNKDISNRRILVHGANENGKCSTHNSDNCLIPLIKTLTKDEFKSIFNFETGYLQELIGQSKAMTTAKVKNLPLSFRKIFTVTRV